MKTTYNWGFDFGLKWFGEAVQEKSESGIYFPVKESWFVPAELAQRGPATKSGTPASKHRAWKVREARKAREEWLEQIWHEAKLEVLPGRKVGRVDADGKEISNPELEKKKGKWVELAKGDPRLEREFAALGDDTCYTSCLLRIKLLRRDELKPWQIFKALRSAIQKRGYGKVPWAAKEAARSAKKSKEEEAKELEIEKRWSLFQKGFKAWEDEKSDPSRKAIPKEFHRPCYYDAFQMGLWNPEKPEEYSAFHSHTASSTRDVRFPRQAVNDEIIALGNFAASNEQLPALKAAFEKIKSDGWLITDEISWQDSKRNITKRGKRVRKLTVLAKSFGEFLCYGPGGKEYASCDPKTVKELEIEVLEHPDPSQVGKKKKKLRRGTDLDWLGGVGQKIPKFDNRIVEQCALIPRLHVCRVAPAWKKEKESKAKYMDERSLLAAEIIFLMQLKNLQVDDSDNGGVRHLKPVELKEWLDKIRGDQVADKIAETQFADGWEGKVLECFKITKPQWRKWCGEKSFEPIGVDRADADIDADNDNSDNATKSGSKTKDDVVKSPKPSGRSRLSRPALAILKHILLQDESPLAFAEKIRSRNRKLLDDLGLFDVLEKEPLRSDRNHVAFEKTGRPWLLFSDLDFLDWIWKPTDDKGRPRAYEPYQLRIPDMALRHLRKKHELGANPKPYAQLLQEHFEELKRRKQQPSGNVKPTEFERQQHAIHELIGQQNNPIVRDRLTRFWRRLQHFQNPKNSNENPDLKNIKPGLGLPEPECVALEFVRDDKDNSLEGEKKVKTYQNFLEKNEKRRNTAREALRNSKLPDNDEMVVRWLLYQEQGPVCIYSGEPIGCSDLRNLQIEHIIPRSLGGPDAYWNWVLCKEDQNAEKGNRTPYHWFHQEKTPAQWEIYRRYIRSRQGWLGQRKVDLLLRADAAQLVGEKYTSLAATSWIARVAQSIARLHFGWQPDDEPGKEKVVTISGGLTARIRRKYLLDSLLGTDDESDELRKQVNEVLDEIDELRKHPEPRSESAKAKRGIVRQRLSEVARNSEKNREDQRHHALDAMLLTFLPNWARDKNKADFFRLDDIGDNPLYSKAGEKETAAFNNQIQNIYGEIKPTLEQIKDARKAEDWKKMEQLRDSIFEQRKQLALLYKSCDKIKQPRNIRAVRDWFQEQIMGKRPVLPRPAAFEKTAVEASLYRRVYLVRRGQMEAKRIALPELGFRPDIKAFGLKWLHARIHSITDASNDYDCAELKQLLGDKFKNAMAECRKQKRNFVESDWQSIVADETVRKSFPKKGRSKNKELAESSDCEVKVFRVDVVPVKRYELADLAYADGKTDVWNPDYFQDSIGKILRRDESQPRSRSRGGKQVRLQMVPIQQTQGSIPRWSGFLEDFESQDKLKKLQNEVEQLAKLLPGAKPKKMTEEEKGAWSDILKALENGINQFLQKNDLPKYPFLSPSEGDRPPKRFTPWKRILFESKDRIFSIDELEGTGRKRDWLNREFGMFCRLFGKVCRKS